MSTAKYLFLIATLLLFFEFVFYFPVLPGKIAAHFNFEGFADAWYDKPNYYLFFLLVYVLTAGSLAVIAYSIPFLPNSLINIPNRDVLLNNDNRKKTLKIISDHIFHIGTVTIFLLIATNYFIFQLNVKGENFLPRSIFILLFAYLLFVAVIFIHLFKKLRSPDFTHSGKNFAVHR